MSTSTNKNKKTTSFAGNNLTVKRGNQSQRSGVSASVKRSVYGGKSRTLVSSSSRRAVQVQEPKPTGPGGAPVQVYDEEGHDVTPLPLLLQDPSNVRNKQSNVLADSSGGTPTDLLSQASIYQTGTVTASTFGGPFTRSVFSASQSGRSTGSIDESMGDNAEAIHGWTDAKVTYKREEVPEQLTDADLEKVVTINLCETETIWLIDMTGICVSLESEEAVQVRDQNTKYQELVKSRAGNDRYAERGMGTFNDAPKVKSIQTTKIGYQDTGINASTWDMYDTYKLVEEAAAKAAKDLEEGDDTLSRPVSAAPDGQVEGIDGEEPPEGKEPTPQASVKALDFRPKTNIIKYQDLINPIRPILPKATSSDDGDHWHQSQATMSSTTDSVFASKDSGVNAKVPEEEKQDDSTILESESFRKALQIMERTINLNNYQPRQAAYRGFDVIPDTAWLLSRKGSSKHSHEGSSKHSHHSSNNFVVVSSSPLQSGPLDVVNMKPVFSHVDRDSEKEKVETLEEQVKKAVSVTSEDMGPTLERLWEYKCSLTKGRNVSCIAWNKENPDLLAVGYGQFDFSKQKGGLVCCWSLKNPEYPERVYTTEVGVTSMDFSLAHANLLAVGLYNGTVAIYNVRTMSNDPVLDSFESSGKHTCPVWQLKWIEKDRGSEEKTEVLVSISTDGRVTQWSIRKGFESYDLMKLKRVAPKTAGGKVKKTEALISKYAGGLCFDFNIKDTNIYIAGTEEGHIHRCSCSYNEQYLDSYFGHQGPVYGIQWSPFSNEVFLSCSGDWSIRLWHQDRLKPVLNFFSSTKSVPSVCWSPRSSTVFACVNEGSVEVWDLSQSTLDPIITNTPQPGIKLSSVSFAQNSECILVGDSEGQVSVYQLKSMPAPPEKQAEALHKLIQSSLASELPSKK